MDADAVARRLAADAAGVESFLSAFVRGEGLLRETPQGLPAAMEYSLLAGGKRLRPALCLAFARLANEVNGADTLTGDEKILPFAAAIECIHTYSLIHDDLPAMDDDDLRRGKPSCHKKFDEATAILAGDALLTDAFALMASCAPALPAERVLEAVGVMAAAAGSPGMVGGQFLDMGYTGRQDLDLERLLAMQALKTGALLTASCLCGAVLAGADGGLRAAAAAYGRSLGAAFQISDDILDEVGDEAAMGKPVGSDAAGGKATCVSLLGLEKSRALAEKERDAALAALAPYGDRPGCDFLRGLAVYVVDRVN